MRKSCTTVLLSMLGGFAIGAMVCRHHLKSMGIDPDGGKNLGEHFHEEFEKLHRKMMEKHQELMRLHAELGTCSCQKGAGESKPTED